jgi:regulator of sirC expression with transglutaminase-like and TPR domain
MFCKNNMLLTIKHVTILSLTLCFLLQFQFNVNADEVQHKEITQKVENAFQGLDSDIDLLSTLLDFELIIDSNIQVKETRKQVEEMAAKIQKMSSPESTTIDKISSLSKFLYTSGAWNNNKPFQYDYNDPLGTKISNKLVSNYIKTKNGNCVSMPMLYLILSKKLGLEATLSAAPLHYFIMIKEPHSKAFYCVEATHKGQITQKDFYRTKLAISDQAIEQGVYLQPLDNKEIVAVMAILLSEYFAEIEQWNLSIEIAKVVLKHYSNCAYAMIKAGNGYYKLLSSELKKVGNTPNPRDKSYMDYLFSQNIYWFNKADQLGWKPPSEQENIEYLSNVKKHNELLKEQSKGN